MENGSKMENGSSTMIKWGFKENKEVHAAAAFTVRDVLDTISENLNADLTTIHLGRGDPSAFPSYRTTAVAVDAIVDAVRSADFNCYCPAAGITPARRSVAEYLSRDLPYKLTDDDVFLTCGAHHAIEVILNALATPGANILLPKPGYPFYEARAAVGHIEVRHYNLLPEKGWDIDLEGLEALSDDKTVAMVMVNPGNPCGNVFTYEHLKKVAVTARKLGILVISDEVYGHLAFGSHPFTPMGTFGSIAPVLTVGSISKRWIVPGWRMGWIATTDPSGILRKYGIVESIKSCLSITADPVTFVQGAIPQILENTTEDFFLKINKTLGQAADICYNTLKDIPCITCVGKPEGSMSTMVKLNLSLLEGVSDDIDFCTKLATEESVIILPGVAVGLKNFVRITFAVEPTSLEEALGRMKAFCSRYAKN